MPTPARLMRRKPKASPIKLMYSPIARASAALMDTRVNTNPLCTSSTITAVRVLRLRVITAQCSPRCTSISAVKSTSVPGWRMSGLLTSVQTYRKTTAAVSMYQNHTTCWLSSSGG